MTHCVICLREVKRTAGARRVAESRCQRHYLPVSRLVASEHGLRALVALSQRPDGLRPAEVATILDVSFSSAERALRVLEDDGLVERPDRRFVLMGDARAGTAVHFAFAMVEPTEALAVVARANRAVEFAGVDAAGRSPRDPALRRARR